jgi:hypothetical protein
LEDGASVLFAKGHQEFGSMGIPHLNGLQRLGVVASALWLVYAILIGVNQSRLVESGEGDFVLTIPGKEIPCPLTKEDTSSTSSGKNEISVEEFFGKDMVATTCTSPDLHLFNQPRFFAFLFLPIILVWVFVYLVIYAIRWIAAGFKHKSA